MRAMIRAGLLVGALVLLVAASVPALAAEQPAGRAAAPQVAGPAVPLNQSYFRSMMRKLWEDHITFTRLFIVSAATLPDALPDIDATTQRLLKNQVDIGNAIKRFYGVAAGDRLTELLKEHITTAAELVAAAKAGDNTRTADAKARWYANADEIAAFLHGANPKNWPLRDLQMMMKDHLDLTLDEAVARLQGRYGDDIAIYERVHREILGMSDGLGERDHPPVPAAVPALTEARRRYSWSGHPGRSTPARGPRGCLS